MTHPCRHLDYEDGKFTDCTIQTVSGFDVRYWLRGKTWTEGTEFPSKVQFCKLRGRINGIFQCYNEGEMPCYEREEVR